MQALSLALQMEKEVTARMKLMIDVCSEAGAEAESISSKKCGRNICVFAEIDLQVENIIFKPIFSTKH